MKKPFLGEKARIRNHFFSGEKNDSNSAFSPCATVAYFSTQSIGDSSKKENNWENRLPKTCFAERPSIVSNERFTPRYW